MSFKLSIVSNAGLLSVLCLSLSLPGCAGQPPAATGAAPRAMGYSGMTRLDPKTYLVVHDFKRAGPRLGLLRVTGKGAPQYEPLDTADWPSPHNRATDLEALCALPDGGFLAAESSPSAARAARIFHFELSGKSPRLRQTVPMPRGAPHPNNVEAMACASRRDGRVLLLLGERGGSTQYPQGVLYWGYFDPAAGTLFWPPSGRAGAAIHPPSLWPNVRERRAIADFYLDAKGALWAVASVDGGNDGPFRSIVYQAATVHPNNEPPVDINPKPCARWIFDGLKVEALAAPSSAITGSVLSFATDDEHYGGLWRPLYDSPVDCDGKLGAARYFPQRVVRSASG